MYSRRSSAARCGRRWRSDAPGPASGSSISLRRMPRDGDVCFSRFDGWLKQHRPAALSRPQLDLMAIAFPGFLPNEDTRAQRTRSFVTADAGVSAVFDPHHPERREYVMSKSPRRFAGDQDFPGGRYHIVAWDEQGCDKGTLLAELSAYMRPAPAPLILVEDLTEAAAAEPYGLAQQPALLMSFSSEEWRTDPVKSALEAAACEPGGPHVFEFDGALGRRRAIRIPYVVEKAGIDNVVDLRLPQTQTWFARAFGIERRHVYMDMRDRAELAQRLTAEMRADHAKLFPLPTRFVDMLPALLWHEIGGGSSVNQAIAGWMRHNGVAGLIFPSARVNCGVICRDGKLTHFRGWNFVDYRDLKPPANGGFIDTGSWPDSLGEGVRIHFATNAEYEGSWYLEGFAELQARQRDQVIVRPDGLITAAAECVPARKGQIAPPQPRKLAFEATHTPVTSRPEQFQTGPDWFDFVPGGQCLDIRCPRCSWLNVWDRGEEEAPERCPRCGFNAEAKRALHED
jgi:hypothetical protein